MNRGFKAPSPAMVVSVTALFVALGGTGYAATAVAGHASTAGAARHSKAKKKSKPNDNRQDTALINKLAPRLRVAFAKNAGTATNATNAVTATNASHATSATSATNATNATSAVNAVNAVNATHATTATNATHATAADTATNATHATTADTATNADLLGGLPGSLYQQRNAEGSAQAGALITSTGGITSWFNASGGAPTVTHPSTGVYDISFQGLNVQDNNTVTLVTPNTPSADCTATNASNVSNASTTFIVVETKDCNGTVADRGFHVIAFGDGPTG